MSIVTSLKGKHGKKTSLSIFKKKAHRRFRRGANVAVQTGKEINHSPKMTDWTIS